MRRLRRYSLAVAVGQAIIASGCTGGEQASPAVARGRGLPVASLSPADQARIYDAAVRSAFDVGPALSLLLAPRMLPRTAGRTGGDPAPSPLVEALRAREVIRGTCDPPVAEKRAPTCQAAAPGYIVRFSPVFRFAADTVQLYLYAERYDTPASGAHQALRFERAYQIVRGGESWRVVREARIPES
jgi:hypothetical protein